MKDDPRLDALPPKQKKIVEDGIANLQAEKIYDELAQTIIDAPKTKSILQEAIGAMKSLETVAARPITVNAVMPKPAVVGKKQTPVSAIRRLAGAVVAEMTRLHDQTDPETTIAKLFAGDGHSMTRHKVAAYLKSATDPASTTVSGFAAELVKSSNTDFWDALQERSATAQLRAMGVPLDFSGLGSLTIPRRASGDTGSMRPGFVRGWQVFQSHKPLLSA